ncbi:MAG: hypothetical protein EHM21_15380, partial [Chloroflexi bacterium]
MNSALLVTKLYLPEPRPDRIVRPRLVQRLNDGLHSGCRLTLVCAPAGYGKTTLVSDWLASLEPAGEGPVMWLSLDEGDNDPRTFFTYLLAALRRAYPETGESIASLLGLAQLPPLSSLMVLWINELAGFGERVSRPGRLVLVLDDYQCIHHPPLHDAVELLLNQAPTGLHLALVTREDPPFPLARLRGQGRMTEIRAADLRFYREESEAFFQTALHQALPEDLLLILNERCEGWAAGLRMAALSLKTCQDPAAFIQAFGGSHHHITDFLMEEVLQRLPQEMRTFIHQTAILDRFNAGLCCALAGADEPEQKEDCRRLLLDLNRANLFIIALDETRTWYRFHTLFADLLRSRLEASEKQHLHRRAALWFEREGLLREGIQHALAAQDLALAAGLVRSAAGEAIQRADLGLLMSWLQSLPVELVSGDPDLAFYQSFLFFMNGKMQPAAEMLARLEENAALAAHPRLSGRVMVLRAWMDSVIKGQVDVERVHQAYALMGTEDVLFQVLACQPLGSAQVKAGNLPAASAIFAEAWRAGQKLANPAASLGNLYSWA